MNIRAPAESKSSMKNKWHIICRQGGHLNFNGYHAIVTLSQAIRWKIDWANLCTR